MTLNKFKCTSTKIFLEIHLKMVVPCKIKLFAWRACLNCLPTCDKLKQKKVTPKNMCALCNAEVENAPHALVFSHRI